MKKLLSCLLMAVLLTGCATLMSTPMFYKSFAEKYPTLTRENFIPPLGEYLLIDCREQWNVPAYYAGTVAELKHPEQETYVFWIDHNVDDNNLDGKPDGVLVIWQAGVEWQLQWISESHVAEFEAIIDKVHKELGSSLAQDRVVVKMKLPPSGWQKKLKELNKFFSNDAAEL